METIFKEINHLIISLSHKRDGLGYWVMIDAQDLVNKKICSAEEAKTYMEAYRESFLKALKISKDDTLLPPTTANAIGHIMVNVHNGTDCEETDKQFITAFETAHTAAEKAIAPHTQRLPTPPGGVPART